MFLLSLLPEPLMAFIVHALFFTGLIATILSLAVADKLALAFPYYRAIQLCSILLLSSGIYLEGAYSMEMSWRSRVHAVETKAAAAKEASTAVNTDLSDKTEAKIKIIHERGETVIQYVDREVIKYDASCAIPEPVIAAHNAAARNQEMK